MHKVLIEDLNRKLNRNIVIDLTFVNINKFFCPVLCVCFLFYFSVVKVF